MIEYLLWIFIGSLYGMLIGIIPVAGVTTALLTVFSMGDYFLSDPYLGVVFLTSIIASCASADSYTSILTGIPGANTTAASIIDGYPMSKKGEAGRAIGISIFDSTVNGVLYGLLAFALLPYYGKVILYLGIPEFAAFMILSIICVGFVISKNIFKSLIAISLGLFFGMIGQEPSTGTPRLTFGWDYLEAGIQIIPIISGLFGFAELYDGFKHKKPNLPVIQNYKEQVLQGFSDCIRNYKDMLRGGLIGFATGLLPGVGGAIGDFLAYGSTTAKYKKETFGNGNPKGLLGCEGANNAQKVSSMIPTVLFGIPAAPFAAIMMAICMYFGIELGTPSLLDNQQFTNSLLIGYLSGTILVAIFSLLLMKQIIKLLSAPYWIYALVISLVIIYANLEYTGTWRDIAILFAFSIIGVVFKKYEISRPAVLITYVIAERVESYTKQSLQLYSVEELISRPLVIIILVIAIGLFIKSFKHKGFSYT